MIKFEGETENIKSDVFCLGNNMENICLKSKEVFITSYIGQNHKTNK